MQRDLNPAVNRDSKQLLGIFGSYATNSEYNLIIYYSPWYYQLGKTGRFVRNSNKEEV